jgi:hypothetical protein
MSLYLRERKTCNDVNIRQFSLTSRFDRTLAARRAGEPTLGEHRASHAPRHGHPWVLPLLPLCYLRARWRPRRALTIVTGTRPLRRRFEGDKSRLFEGDIEGNILTGVVRRAGARETLGEQACMDAAPPKERLSYRIRAAVGKCFVCLGN